MDTCPRCKTEVTVPGTFDFRGWSEFTCPNCESKLGRRAPRSPWQALPHILLLVTCAAQLLGMNHSALKAGYLAYLILQTVVLTRTYASPELYAKTSPVYKLWLAGTSANH